MIPLEESGEINDPDLACPNFSLTYTVDAPVGATEFFWTLDGQAVGNSSSNADILFPSPGDYELCVISANRCDQGPPSCKVIRVEPIPPTNLIEVVCEGECFSVADTLICETGQYNFILQNELGCDSLVNFDLTVQPTPVSSLNIFLCEEDTFFIGNLPFTESGSYQEILPSFLECDSIVNLELEIVICEIQSATDIQPVDCIAENSGQIDFMVTDGTPPFTYSWEQLDGFVTGFGSIDFLNINTSLVGLTSGTYSITIEDGFGNFNFIVKGVSQPEQLSVELIPMDRNGFEVSCPEAMDGAIIANVTGGNSGNNFIWNNGETAPLIDQLTIGDYSVIVTDSKGCNTTENIMLTAPIPVEISVDFVGPDCTGASSGIIDITQTSGGTGVYQYMLNGTTNSSQPLFTDLTAGDYEILVTDENGCTALANGTLTAFEIPIVDLGESQTINLGTVLELNPFTVSYTHLTLPTKA